MKGSELLRLVWLNINQNRFKAIMTSIGIVVGAATILLVIGIGRGGQMDIAEQFAELNAGAIDITYEYEGEDISSSDGGFSLGGMAQFFADQIGGMFGGGMGSAMPGGGMPGGSSDSSDGSSFMPSPPSGDFGGNAGDGSGMPSGGPSGNAGNGSDMPSGGPGGNGSGDSDMPSGGPGGSGSNGSDVSSGSSDENAEDGSNGDTADGERPDGEAGSSADDRHPEENADGTSNQAGDAAEENDTTGEGESETGESLIAG